MGQQSQLLVPVALNGLDALSNRCSGSMLHCVAHAFRTQAHKPAMQGPASC